MENEAAAHDWRTVTYHFSIATRAHYAGKNPNPLQSFSNCEAASMKPVIIVDSTEPPLVSFTRLFCICFETTKDSSEPEGWVVGRPFSGYGKMWKESALLWAWPLEGFLTCIQTMLLKSSVKMPKTTLAASIPGHRA